METGSRLVVAPSGRLRYVRQQAPIPAISSSLRRAAPAPRAGAGPRPRRGGMDADLMRPRELRPGIRCGVPRDVLGNRRRDVAGVAVTSDRYLSDRRVTARTAANYRGAFQAFASWAARHRHSISPNSVDRSLRKYLLHMFFTGGAPFDGRLALHGTIFVKELPRSPQSLPLSRDALAGFSTVVPELQRDPLPDEAKTLIAHDLLQSEGDQGFMAAGALVTAFDGFLRPSETVELESAHLHVLRGIRRRVDVPSVTATIRPLTPYCPGYDPPKRTKSGQHDDTVVFGRSASLLGGEPWIASFLSILKTKRRGKLFPLSLHTWEVLMKRSAGRLGLSALKPTPHCARHGAASHAYASGRLSLRDIQKKGRWLNPKSVRTYEKSGKLARQLGRMSTAQRSRARALSTTLPHSLIAAAKALQRR